MIRTDFFFLVKLLCFVGLLLSVSQAAAAPRDEVSAVKSLRGRSGADNLPTKQAVNSENEQLNAAPSDRRNIAEKSSRERSVSRQVPARRARNSGEAQISAAEIRDRVKPQTSPKPLSFKQINNNQPLKVRPCTRASFIVETTGGVGSVTAVKVVDQLPGRPVKWNISPINSGGQGPNITNPEADQEVFASQNSPAPDTRFEVWADPFSSAAPANEEPGFAVFVRDANGTEINRIFRYSFEGNPFNVEDLKIHFKALPQPSFPIGWIVKSNYKYTPNHKFQCGNEERAMPLFGFTAEYPDGLRYQMSPGADDVDSNEVVWSGQPRTESDTFFVPSLNKGQTIKMYLRQNGSTFSNAVTLTLPKTQRTVTQRVRLGSRSLMDVGKPQKIQFSTESAGGTPAWITAGKTDCGTSYTTFVSARVNPIGGIGSGGTAKVTKTPAKGSIVTPQNTVEVEAQRNDPAQEFVFDIEADLEFHQGMCPDRQVS